jgi:hypothetical protein
MPKRDRLPKSAATKKHATHILSLKLETTERNRPNVDADAFFTTASSWLNALKTFAKEQGEPVRWEIVDLRKSSALIQVQPVKLKTGIPVPTLAKKWDEGLRHIEKTGKPAATFTPEALAALQEFVFDIPRDTIVSVGNGIHVDRTPITAYTVRRVEEAVRHLPEQPRTEYVSQGSIRGRLAVLDSWNPEDRSFHLQLPLNPAKHVKCTYRDSSLAFELGVGFEGIVEITGKLRYKPNQPWPFAADVDHIRVLPRKPVVALEALIGLIHLPDGQDSVSYVRSLRDAEQ